MSGPIRLLLAFVTLCVFSNSLSPLCNPITCSMGTSSTYLTIISRGDGVGATIQQIIYAAAYAAKRGWNFGGITEPNYSHGVMKDVVMEFLFRNYEGILRKNRIGNMKLNRVQIHDIASLESFKTQENTVIEYQDIKFDLDSLGDINTFITSNFLEILRCGAYCGVSKCMNDGSMFVSNHSSIKVVAHIRRGDVQLNDSSRITSDFTYFRIFDTIKQFYPNSEFHAFTSTTQRSPVYTQMIASYAKHGVNLHVDSENYDDFENDYTATNAVIFVWSHFISADILIASKSSFSTVPALFNSKCVFFQRFWHKPLNGWMSLPINEDGNISKDHKRLEKVFKVRLQRCLSRLHISGVFGAPARCKICPP